MNETILNPLVVLAETLEVIEPSVLDEAVPPANQFQPTKVEPLPFVKSSVPNVKPSLSKDVNACVSVPSACVAFDFNAFVAPLTLSNILWSAMFDLFLIQLNLS